MTRRLLSLVLLILFLSPALLPADASAGRLGINRKAKSAGQNREYKKRRSEYDDTKKREAKREARQKKYDKRRAKDEERRKKRRRASGEDEEEESDYDSRTLGRSCMYGPGGKVIYRPRGARCKGDSPRDSEADGRRPPLQQLESAPAAAPQPRAPARPRKKKIRATGRCTYGAGGKLVYAPPGVDCRK